LRGFGVGTGEEATDSSGEDAAASVACRLKANRPMNQAFR
jgi:hypothetical protein